MDIQFYMPLPTVEFFTWLAIYFQFGLLVTLFMSFGVRHNNQSMVFQVVLSSSIIVPALTYILITDYKGFKNYFYEIWIETPADKRKRFDRDI